MKTHKLKITPQYFYDICYRNKRFEVRKDDRNYQVGDKILFEEYDPETKTYTGRSFSPDRPIQYILKDCPFGVEKGYCVLGW